MKLLNIPERVTETVELNHRGIPLQIAGMGHISNVKILCPESPKDSKAEVWNKLKYGYTLDLEIGRKESAIKFPDSNIVLFGVIPVSMTRTGIGGDRCFECMVDHFEKIK